MRYGEPERIPAFDDPELEPVDMWAATIEPRMASHMMRVLGEAAPLTGLQHLKRIRKLGGGRKLLQILLCRRADSTARPAEGSAVDQSAGPSLEGLGLTSQLGTPMEAEPSPLTPAVVARGGPAAAAATAASGSVRASAPGGGAGAAADAAAAIEALPPAVADITRDQKLAPVPVQVPKHAPVTKALWAQWCALWPLTWRPPEQMRPEDGVPVTAAGRDAMVAGMDAAFAAAAEARARGQNGNGCVIVDPVTGEVVASGSDNSVTHPLKHAIMVAVDAMGRRDLRLWPDWYHGHRHRLRDGGAALASEELPCKRRRLSEDGSSSRGGSPVTDATSRQPAAGGAPSAPLPQLQAHAQPHAQPHALAQAHAAASGSQPAHTPAAGGAQTSASLEGNAARSAAQPSKPRQPQQQNGAPARGAADCAPARPNGMASAAEGAAAALASGPAAGCACGQVPRAHGGDEAACGKSPAATNGGSGGKGGRAGSGGSAGSDGRRGGGSSSGSEVPLAQQKPYLCTGFDCYVVQEPCAMCAMVLVHSRLRRVVFCHPDPAMGAVASRYRLHGQRSLNHKYQVFRLPLASGASGGDGHAGGATGNGVDT